MKHYELVYIVAGKYAETEVHEIMGRIDDLIAKNGGTVTFTQYWERKKLAYPIDHIVYGHYVITELDMAPNMVAGFEKSLRLSTNEVIRHLIVTKDTVGAPRVMEVKPVAKEDAIPTTDETPAAKTVAVKTEVKTAVEPVTAEQVAVAEEVVEPKPVETSSDVVAEEVAAPKKDVESEPVPEAKTKKKTDNKVSFEDLDKKLDEILNNDIL